MTFKLKIRTKKDLGRLKPACQKKKMDIMTDNLFYIFKVERYGHHHT